MTNIADIAALIIARRQQLDRVMRSDLVKLQTQVGEKTLREAIRLADQAAAKDALSISGERKRPSDERQDQNAAQAFRQKDRT